MARTTPVVRAETVTWSVDRHEHQFAVDTPSWYAWLEEISTFAFVSDMGTFTARKEPTQHGGPYWKAYRKRNGKLHRAYLGKSHDVTLERLNAVAAMLSGQGDTPERGVPGDEMLQVHQASITQQPPNMSVTQRLTTPESAPKHNLPLQLTSLVGREQDTAAAVKLLRHPEVRLLTLIGPAGVGKTRLALQVATDLVESFADGFFFVSLAPVRDTELVLSTVAQTLGLQAMGSRSFLDLLKTYLQDKHCLLLLDNFEQVVGAAPLLADLLEACPDLKVLVTSREVLHLRAEHQFPVPPLALPDLTHLPEYTVLAQYPAVNLFLQRAQAVRPDVQLTPGNAAAIAALCIHLDGLPLAIELAAARVKWLAPRELLSRLDRRLQLLTGGACDLPERQQTLRNTITWSYDLLSAEEQRLFRLLAVFVGGCQLEAVEAVSRTLGDGTIPIWHGVSSLVDKSLLQPMEQVGEGPRFIMLETLREYGLERLAAHGEEEATREAHAAYYLRLSEEAEQSPFGAEHTLWFQRLEREYDNLLAALRWSLEPGESGHRIVLALRLVEVLTGFWIRHGHFSEGRIFLERALAGSQGVMVPVRAKALAAATYVALNQGDLDWATTLSEENLALSRELGDTAGIAGILAQKGLIAQMRADLDAACSLGEEAVSLARETGDRFFIADVLHDLAFARLERGEYTRACAMYEECLAVFREMDHKTGIAASLHQLALALFLSLGDHERIHSLLDESFEIWKEIGSPNGIGVWSYLAGQVALYQGDAAQARTLLEESVTLYKEMGDRWHIAWSLSGLAKVEAIQGNYAVACTLYKENLALCRQMGSKNIAPALEGLADVAVRQGQPAWAARLWGAAETLREVIRYPLPPVERADYEHAVAGARASLGEQAFTSLWAKGRNMSLEHVLADQEPVPSPRSALTASPSAVVLPQASDTGLTHREMDVLRLLTQGLTSAQIAEQLIIGVVTVNFHVRSIYSKLGVSSRSAATRYAIEHHLV